MTQYKQRKPIPQRQAGYVNQRSSQRRNAKSKNNHSKSVKAFVIFFLTCIFVIIGLFYFALNTDFCAKHFGKDAAITQFFEKLAISNSQKSEADFTFPLTGRRKNILLLGVDASDNPDDLWSGTRTDTIILMNIDPRTKSINALSIPRDSKVYLAGNAGIQKINAAHAIGGVEMTVKTVENTLGVKVDKYIMVHDSAVKAIVEALGGVDVYVEKNMRYHDWAGHLHIDLTKGYHHLSPEEAVGYLRFRHDPMGDIGRTRRQQWFLRGLLTDLKKPETVSKIPEIVGVARKYIKTDMSMYDLTQFAMFTKGLDMDRVEIAVLPGGPNKHGSVSYWILDPEKTQEVVNRLIYRRKPVVDEMVAPRASVVYSDSKVSAAKNLISELKTQDVEVNCESRVTKAHSQFIAHTPNITNEYFNHLKKQIPDLEGYQFVYEPSFYLCGESDFTVVVAGK